MKDATGSEVYEADERGTYEYLDIKDESADHWSLFFKGVGQRYVLKSDSTEIDRRARTVTMPDTLAQNIGLKVQPPQ